MLVHEVAIWLSWNLHRGRGHGQPWKQLLVRLGYKPLRCHSFDVVNEVAVLVEKTAFERHYRVGELAELWGLGRETVRKLIMNEPGVVKIRLGRRKAHTVYSVPQSVAERVHTRLLNAA
jgi:hypothetical protein